MFSSPHEDTPTVGVVPGTCFAQMEFAGVLHGAKNPAGAQALVDFMLTRRFQEDMPLQMYVNPVVPGATLPAVFAKWASTRRTRTRSTPRRSARTATTGSRSGRRSWCSERARVARARRVAIPLGFLGVFFVWPVAAIFGRSLHGRRARRRAHRPGLPARRVVHALAGGASRPC